MTSEAGDPVTTSLEDAHNVLGRVVALWRYPVKSMQGELLNASAVDQRGLLGDRALALLDVETGKVASAKSPRMWPNLLNFCATFVEPPRVGDPLPPIRITLPDGEHIRSDDPTVDEVLSRATGRAVRLISSNPSGAKYEYYVPDVADVDPGGRDFYREYPNDMFGTGALHDTAPVHLLTTATLSRLSELYPDGRFEVRRFRPNIVVEPTGDVRGFVENSWLKRGLGIGTVTLRVTIPMNRCVMTTLPQVDLPRDLGILRTAAVHNRLQVQTWGQFPCVGVCGLVRSSGAIRRGDIVTSIDRRELDGGAERVP
jgi:uncharacterized protein